VEQVSFVIPVGDEDRFQKNFVSSPLFQDNPFLEIMPQRGFANASLAFNDAIERASHDLIIFSHEDVVLPRNWLSVFCNALSMINVPDIGVVGCWGITANGQYAGHVFTHHDRELSANRSLPAEVETLDELLISFRKSSGLRFDCALPGFLCYSIDICVESSARGLLNFAIDAPCFHNAKGRYRFINQPQYYQGLKYIRKKWRRRLPIRTASGTIRRYSAYPYLRAKEILYAFLKIKIIPYWHYLPVINPDEKLKGS
jgi:hypothetical protein